MAVQTDEDLFQGSTMTFGEHLEELRSCLIKALLWLLAGFAVGLLVGEWMVATLQGPLESSLRTHYEQSGKREYREFAAAQEAAGLPSPYTVDEVDRLLNAGYVYDKYLVHPPALRRQLGIESPVDAPRGAADEQASRDASGEPQLVPLLVWRKSKEDPRVSVLALNPTEAFMIWLKASLVVGLVLASPMIFYHLWSFVAAGLYPHEKRYVHIFFPVSVLLFLGGALFCFFVVFRFILDFLFSFNADLGIDPTPRISEWLSFAIILPVGFGISFQLPLVMLFLERIGMFDVPAYMSKWRIAVLIIAVVSMLLTPADPISMLAMAIPLTALYFLGIGMCRYLPRQKSLLER
ncbi:MAG: twin-arginine translocase subunit TatC [Planctomycetales bacterium]|nr:twin-arginine translocase subunit TatC [Planctomycetales bacterium]